MIYKLLQVNVYGQYIVSIIISYISLKNKTSIPQLADQSIKYICIKIKLLNHICAFVVNYILLRHFFVTRIDAP